MRVGIVSVGKSTNIGDQLIAYCLGQTISDQEQPTEIEYFDLYDGQYDINFQHDSSTTKKLNRDSGKRAYLPRAIKLYIANWILYKNYKNQVRDFCTDKDIIIIGGGHLLIDNYLSFAIKIDQFIRFSGLKLEKIVFWSVGVGTNHSWLWKKLMKKHLLNASVFPRDTQSCSRLRKLLNRYDIIPVLDCAFFTKNHLSKPTAPAVHGKIKIGLFIMDPHEMIRHSSFTISRDDAAAWWVKLIEILQPEYQIVIGNNGSHNDYQFIEQYINRKISNKVITLPQSLSCFQLIEAVNNCHIIIGQRLHSIIPAISLEKKFLAIDWDTKLNDILDDLGLKNNLISYQTPVETIASNIKTLKPSPTHGIAEKQKHYREKLKDVINAR